MTPSELAMYEVEQALLTYPPGDPKFWDAMRDLIARYHEMEVSR